MADEKSAGVVLFCGEPRKFLLLHYPSDHWDFPKGHIEPGESEEEATSRELEEETGISLSKFFNGFRETVTYFYQSKGKTIHKTVVYFLAESPTKEIVLSHEHRGFKWLIFENAMKMITFDNSRNVLKKAKEFLDK